MTITLVHDAMSLCLDYCLSFVVYLLVAIFFPLQFIVYPGARVIDHLADPGCHHNCPLEGGWLERDETTRVVLPAPTPGPWPCYLRGLTT